MKLTLDTEARTLVRDGEEIPLYSSRAFELLSLEWVRLGWSLKYYHTFTWMGQPVLQLPEDMIRLQEAIYAVRPDVIIETGINDGGSLLFHATLCEAVARGRVIGIDIRIPQPVREALSAHRLAHRIRIIEGDSASAGIAREVRTSIRSDETVMVILDSHHSAEHVLRELETYAPMVTKGSCIIATDGIMRDLTDVPHGEQAWTEDNPAAAARLFLAAHPEFELREPKWTTPVTPIEHPVTYWPDGWLWKKL